MKARVRINRRFNIEGAVIGWLVEVGSNEDGWTEVQSTSVELNMDGESGGLTKVKIGFFDVEVHLEPRLPNNAHDSKGVKV